jgi:hypothetical protein
LEEKVRLYEFLAFFELQLGLIEIELERVLWVWVVCKEWLSGM